MVVSTKFSNSCHNEEIMEVEHIRKVLTLTNSIVYLLVSGSTNLNYNPHSPLVQLSVNIF